MIYVDTSLVLAERLAEDRVHARKLVRSHGDAARALVGRVALLELVSPVLARALEPFPKPVRTLDALHLASTEFLRERQPAIQLATYDSRQATAARAMGIALYDLDAEGT